MTSFFSPVSKCLAPLLEMCEVLSDITLPVPTVVRPLKLLIIKGCPAVKNLIEVPLGSSIPLSALWTEQSP